MVGNGTLGRCLGDEVQYCMVESHNSGLITMFHCGKYLYQPLWCYLRILSEQNQVKQQVKHYEEVPMEDDVCG